MIRANVVDPIKTISPDFNKIFLKIGEDFKKLKPTKFVKPRFLPKSLPYRKLLVKTIRESQSLIGIKLPDANKSIWLETMVLIQKLLFWDEYLQEKNLPPHLPLREIVCRNLLEGPAFADYLKDVWSYSLRAVTGLNFEAPEDIEIFEFKDINQIFPSEHLIDFQRPEDLSDILDFSFEKPRVNGKLLRDLQHFIDKNIKEDVPLRYFDDIDSISIGNKRKSSNIHTGVKKMSFFERVDTGFPKNLSNELNFVVSSVHKSPSESRVIAISDIPTRNLLYIVRENVSLLLNSKYDAYASKRPWIWRSKLHYDENIIKIMFDQRKSGWTFPFELMAMFYERLCLKYPDYEPFATIRDIFKEGKINYLIKDCLYKPLRGFILGMQDHVCSFIMSCLFELFLEEEVEDEEMEAFDAMFFGDDSTILIDKSKTIHTVTYWWNRWISITKKAGIFINEKKSYLSKVGVFCEMYGDNSPWTLFRHTKVLLNMLNTMKCWNISHCKYFYKDIIDFVSSYISFLQKGDKEVMTKVLLNIIPFVKASSGTEFEHEEITFPYECGGWERERDEDGKSTFLLKCFESKIPMRYLQVADVTLKLDKFYDKTYLKQNMSEDSWINEILNFYNFSTKNQTIKRNWISALKTYDQKSIKDSDYRLWTDFHDRRQKAYKEINRNYGKNHYYEKFLAKRVKNQALDLRMFRENPNSSKTLFERLSHKGQKSRIDPLRAYALIHKWGDTLASDVRYTKEFSLHYLLGSLFFDLKNLKQVIPINWFRWCEYNDLTLQEVESYMYAKYYVDIFRYLPTEHVYKNSLIDTLCKTDSEYIIWEPRISKPLFLTESETDEYLNTPEGRVRDILICRHTTYQHHYIDDIDHAFSDGFNPDKKKKDWEVEDDFESYMALNYENGIEPMDEEPPGEAIADIGNYNFSLEDLEGAEDSYVEASSSDDPYAMSDSEMDYSEFVDQLHHPGIKHKAS